MPVQLWQLEEKKLRKSILLSLPWLNDILHLNDDQTYTSGALFSFVQLLIKKIVIYFKMHASNEQGHRKKNCYDGAVKI